MEEPLSSGDAARPSGEPDVLVLHTADANEWATYLQQIMKSARKFRQRSVLLYEISPADHLHGFNYECYWGCGCILLLVTGELLDMLSNLELQEALERLVSPPHRVVALLCGVTEEDAVRETFKDWASWRKISAEDEPQVYISTILETITDNRQAQTKHESEEPCKKTQNPAAVEKEEVSSGEPIETTLEDEEHVRVRNATNEETSISTHLSCLTVQPSRVLCGTSEKLFIIFTHKVDNHTSVEVEFSSESGSTERVVGTLENEYALSVSAPDMPAGVVSLTMCSDQSSISLQPVTYYTHMGEISQLMEKLTDPVNFMRQAFNLTSNATESLDSMLTESLKSRLPTTSFQLFGVSQIEEDNMATYQRGEELPTLLHFAAKYGLKKLTAVLQECPGALQAYSVMNKHGDYPNKLAEKSGFSDLRQLMDKFVDTAAMTKPKVEAEEPISMDEQADVYEMMSGASQDVAIISEDIYESMFAIDPECVEDLYEVMNCADENPEEAMLRKFFQAKHREEAEQDSVVLESKMALNDAEETEEKEVEEEDPYNITLEDIYDTVDENCIFNPVIQNRPPAPLPRPQPGSEPEMPMIFRVFSEKNLANGDTTPGMASAAATCVEERPSPVYDPYAGMKTPGQRQLISLQERVKVGEITVDEAVNEFKAWKFDQDGRACSVRYQQENLKRLRESITRRHKERQKSGKELDFEISAPLQRNFFWGSTMTMECAVYESAPRVTALPPPPAAPGSQRGTWKTGSTSSTSSSGSNRLSTHSTISNSSGTEPDFEDMSESMHPPPRPPRPSDAGSSTPPMVPPRVPERVPEKMLHERYIPCPTRAVPQRPSQRHSDAAPPVPRRLR